jgi:hypothetical protein
MSKHTPGPWRTDDADTTTTFPREVWDVAKSGKVCVCFQWFFPDNGNETRANAHLIAAAPDLLAALEAISPLLPRSLTTVAHGDPSWTEAIRKVEDAIAKAKRRQVEWRRRRKGEK